MRVAVVRRWKGWRDGCATPGAASSSKLPASRRAAITPSFRTWCGQFVLEACTTNCGSKNCMIEIRASVRQGKLIVPLVEPDVSKGGLTKQQVREQLIKAEET
eukprot:358079-Prymnesium_polylepis.1